MSLAFVVQRRIVIADRLCEWHAALPLPFVSNVQPETYAEQLAYNYRILEGKLDSVGIELRM